MHEPLLAAAALPAQTRICGIPLRHYSLGHELWLIREQSPFVLGGQVLPEDIFDAILICASDWEGLTSPESDWLYIPKLWVMKRKIRKAITENFDLVVKSFREYQQLGGLQLPPSDIPKPGETKGRSLGSPFILLLHDFLCSRYRLTIPQAWNFPCGEAKCRWQAWRELEGQFEVYNDENAEIDALIVEGAKDGS